MFSPVTGRVLTSLVLVLLLISHAYAAEEPVERKGLAPVGEIIFVAGKALVKLFPEDSYRSALPRQGLVPNDSIKTMADARLYVLFKDDTQLKLADNTTLILKEVTANKEKPGTLKIVLRLESGVVWTKSKSAPDDLIIETPYGTAAIKGTEWVLSVEGSESRVAVMEGNVQLSNTLGTITVGRDEKAVATSKEAPVKSILIKPRDRTQWTYYLSERRLLGYLKFKGRKLSEAENLFNEGKLEESARGFEQTLLKEPGSPRILAGLGMIELKTGSGEKAERYFDQSLNIERTSLALLGKAYLAISKNRTVEAAEILRDAVNSFPTDPLSYIFSSYLQTFYGDFPGALRECDRGLSALPNNPLILAFKADLYSILDQPGEAKQTIDILLRENPQSSEGFERLGFYERMVTGDSRKAKDAFRRSILLDPLNDECMAKLADLLREEGYIPEALKLIEEALLIAPWNAIHRYNYGRLLADINKIDRARGEFRKSLNLDPTFSRAYLGEAIILLKEGKPDEALKELSTANLFEPNLAEIHTFLAIAYYQKMNARAALEELKRAEECDPLDSTPHQLRSTIFKDLYRPVEAIDEGRQVLGLLPYRRASGEALLDAGHNGNMSLNKGLDFFSFPEWSLYYAQKAVFITPYRNTSHIGVALAYSQLGDVSSLQGYNEFMDPTQTEALIGLALDANVSFSNRYSTLINKPGQYFTPGGAYAFGDSNEGQADLTAAGNFGHRFPLTYLLIAGGDRDSGHLQNSSYRNWYTILHLAYKPTYDQDMFVQMSYHKNWGEITPALSLSLEKPDNNQDFRDTMNFIQFGYHKRFGPNSHLIAAGRYDYSFGRVENPDFKSDSTYFSTEGVSFRNFAAGIRHLVTLYENHQFTQGIEANLSELTDNSDWVDYPKELLQLSFPEKRRSLYYYVYDRWAAIPGITVDGGLFFTYYSAENSSSFTDNIRHRIYFGETKITRDTYTLNPRIGVAIDLWKKGTLRMAYQSRSNPAFSGVLAPVDTSGLIPPTFNIAFSRADDLEGSVEYELTRRTFLKGLLGYQKLSDLTTIGENGEAQLFYARLAINQILGQMFSFSARYHYNESRYLDGSGRQLPGIPKGSGDARLVFIYPSDIKMVLKESYVGARYADYANTIKLKGYFTTDIYAQKEFFQKRVFLSAAITDLFNKSYVTMSTPHEGIFVGGGSPLPAKGRTYSIRGEYRF